MSSTRQRAALTPLSARAETVVSVTNPNPGPLTNQEVLVTLPTADLALLPSCTDLRVWTAGPDPSPLPFWVENESCGGATVRLWVLVLRLPPGLSQLLVYTGCEQCQDRISSAESVFYRGFFALADYDYRHLVVSMDPTGATIGDGSGFLTLYGGANASGAVPTRTSFSIPLATAVELGFVRPALATQGAADCSKPLVYLNDNRTAALDQTPHTLWATCSELCLDDQCSPCTLLPDASTPGQLNTTFTVSWQPNGYYLSYDSGNVSCSVTAAQALRTPFLYIASGDASTAPRHAEYLSWIALRSAPPRDLGVSAVTHSRVVLVEATLRAADTGLQSATVLEISQNGVYYPRLPPAPALQTVSWRNASLRVVAPPQVAPAGSSIVALSGQGTCRWRSSSQCLGSLHPRRRHSSARRPAYGSHPSVAKSAGCPVAASQLHRRAGRGGRHFAVRRTGSCAARCWIRSSAHGSDQPVLLRRCAGAKHHRAPRRAERAGGRTYRALLQHQRGFQGRKPPQQHVHGDGGESAALR